MQAIEDSRVAVAMSGGVDSAVVAALMSRNAGSVFGITAKLTAEYSKCCADEDICRAEQMCAKLGIEHHVVDLTAEFEAEVMNPFMTGYTSGTTPSPCVNCNRAIKFGALLKRVRDLGADLLATGHYARLVEKDGFIYLRRGVDQVKDQTYFLARLTQEQLRHTVFPLGGMHKSEVTQLAEEFKLAARKSRESQDLCFVTEGAHGDWVELRSFDTRGPGEIVDDSGKVVGLHRGIHHYTIGQRKGLGIALGYPAYVIDIDVEHNRVVVGPREMTLSRKVSVADVAWVGNPPVAGSVLQGQVRYNHRPAACLIRQCSEDSITAEFEQPQFAITPGQLAVFYDGDLVKGSGWIRKRAQC